MTCSQATRQVSAKVFFIFSTVGIISLIFTNKPPVEEIKTESFQVVNKIIVTGIWPYGPNNQVQSALDESGFQ